MLTFAKELGDDRAGGADRPLEDLVGFERPSFSSSSM